jgi:hypothetical protein
MINVAYSLTPGPNSTVAQIPSGHTYSQEAATALDHFCSLLNFNERQITDVAPARITVEEVGRNTGSIHRWEFRGTRVELAKLLCVAYYWSDARCVEPPADYAFGKPEDRQAVLDRIAQEQPRRAMIASWLTELGMMLPDLSDALSYDERGLGFVGIGYAIAVGVRDNADLKLASSVSWRDWSNFAVSALLAAREKVSVASLMG